MIEMKTKDFDIVLQREVNLPPIKGRVITVIGKMNTIVLPRDRAIIINIEEFDGMDLFVGLISGRDEIKRLVHTVRSMTEIKLQRLALANRGDSRRIMKAKASISLKVFNTPFEDALLSIVLESLFSRSPGHNYDRD